MLKKHLQISNIQLFCQFPKTITKDLDMAGACIPQKYSISYGYAANA